MDENEPYSNRFKDILNSFNFLQHIDFPTHKIGHTLDIIATLDGCLDIINIRGLMSMISYRFQGSLVS